MTESLINLVTNYLSVPCRMKKRKKERKKEDKKKKSGSLQSAPDCRFSSLRRAGHICTIIILHDMLMVHRPEIGKKVLAMEPPIQNVSVCT